MKVKSLKKALQGVKDPRRTECGNIRHKLEDILIIALCTIVCNGEDFEDMEEFGKEREEFLRSRIHKVLDIRCDKWYDKPKHAKRGRSMNKTTKRQSYPTDLTDKQWETIEPLFTKMRTYKWSNDELR